jgi:hypothetical protein
MKNYWDEVDPLKYDDILMLNATILHEMSAIPLRK